MNKDELGKLFPIVLENYNSNWSALYEKERNILKSIFPQSL